MKKLLSALLLGLFLTTLIACNPTEPTEYTVDFNVDGGSTINAVTVEDGELLSEPTEPTKDGFTFGGWFKEADLSSEWNFASDTVTSDVTLYAKWTAEQVETYTVTFSTDGGSSITDVVVDDGSLVTEPTVPTKTDFDFAGWYADSALATPWNFESDTITEDTTLYAKWTAVEAETFTVTFTSNGGSTISNVIVEDGDVLTRPADPEKDGYVFAGWFEDDALTLLWNFSSYTITGDTTLYAKWVENVYTVTFDTDGGSVIEPVKNEIDTVLQRPVDPEKDGFVFAGWYTTDSLNTFWNFETDIVDDDMQLFAKWKTETDFTQTFKVLSIGNSFSEDAHKYLWSIANAYGIDPANIVVANMYVGGAPLSTHISNLTSNAAVYEYQLYTSETITRTSGVSISQALAYEDWDVVTFQQASYQSGTPAEYSDHVVTLTQFVEDNATNANVQIMWHMTWAYQQTSTHSGFANYDNDQMTMYNAIVDAVNQKVLTLSQINDVINVGTAIQNARTSYYGDNFTRDGYHLKDPIGRYLAGLAFFKTITGFDLDATSTFKPTGVSDIEQGLVMEAVNDAQTTPYAVTDSTFTTAPPVEPIVVNGVPYEFDYVQGFWGSGATSISPETDAIHTWFAGVLPISRQLLPVGSEIVIDPGYQYRIIFLERDGDNYTVVHRTTFYDTPYVELDETLWGDYDYIAFNITTYPEWSDISDRLNEVAGKLHLYHPEGTGEGHVDGTLEWTIGAWEAAQTELNSSVNHISSNPLTPAFYDYDTVFEVADGYQFAYVVLSYDAGVYTVESVSPYQTEPLIIDETFSTDKELIAFIVTTLTEDVDLSTLDVTTVVDMHPQSVPHVDQEISFISGYWTSGSSAITTTNSNMDFLNGYAASQPQSKSYYENVNSIIIEPGYQLKVIYLSYDGYGNYHVELRSSVLSGTIVLDTVFWGDYDYVAFNISTDPSSDLSGVLDTLPSKLTYDIDPLTFDLGYWNTGNTSLSTSTSYAGSNVIPRQFFPAGTVFTVADGYELRLIFFTKTETGEFKVVDRSNRMIGDVVATDGFYQDYQYIGFNINTLPTTDLTGSLATIQNNITVAPSDPVVNHVDEALSFISGYYEDGKQSITTTNSNMTFLNGFAASNVLSKESLSGMSHIEIADGYRIKIIYLDYSFNTYSVLERSDYLTGTVTLDAAFWGDYDYIAFNIATDPSSDLSGILSTLPDKLMFVKDIVDVNDVVDSFNGLGGTITVDGTDQVVAFTKSAFNSLFYFTTSGTKLGDKVLSDYIYFNLYLESTDVTEVLVELSGYSNMTYYTTFENDMMKLTIVLKPVMLDSQIDALDYINITPMPNSDSATGTIRVVEAYFSNEALVDYTTDTFVSGSEFHEIGSIFTITDNLISWNQGSGYKTLMTRMHGSYADDTALLYPEIELTATVTEEITITIDINGTWYNVTLIPSQTVYTIDLTSPDTGNADLWKFQAGFNLQLMIDTATAGSIDLTSLEFSTEEDIVDVNDVVDSFNGLGGTITVDGTDQVVAFTKSAFNSLFYFTTSGTKLGDKVLSDYIYFNLYLESTDVTEVLVELSGYSNMTYYTTFENDMMKLTIVLKPIMLDSQIDALDYINITPMPNSDSATGTIRVVEAYFSNEALVDYTTDTFVSGSEFHEIGSIFTITDNLISWDAGSGYKTLMTHMHGSYADDTALLYPEIELTATVTEEITITIDINGTWYNVTLIPSQTVYTIDLTSPDTGNADLWKFQAGFNLQLMIDTATAGSIDLTSLEFTTEEDIVDVNDVVDSFNGLGGTITVDGTDQVVAFTKSAFNSLFYFTTSGTKLGDKVLSDYIYFNLYLESTDVTEVLVELSGYSNMTYYTTFENDMMKLTIVLKPIMLDSQIDALDYINITPMPNSDSATGTIRVVEAYFSNEALVDYTTDTFVSGSEFHEIGSIFTITDNLISWDAGSGYKTLMTRMHGSYADDTALLYPEIELTATVTEEITITIDINGTWYNVTLIPSQTVYTIDLTSPDSGNADLWKFEAGFNLQLMINTATAGSIDLTSLEFTTGS